MAERDDSLRLLEGNWNESSEFSVSDEDEYSKSEIFVQEDGLPDALARALLIASILRAIRGSIG